MARKTHVPLSSHRSTRQEPPTKQLLDSIYLDGLLQSLVRLHVR
jgi:hypothetical protein